MVDTEAVNDAVAEILGVEDSEKVLEEAQSVLEIDDDTDFKAL